MSMFSSLSVPLSLDDPSRAHWRESHRTTLHIALEAAICEADGNTDKRVLLVVVSPNYSSLHPAQHFQLKKLALVSVDEMMSDPHYCNIPPQYADQITASIGAKLILAGTEGEDVGIGGYGSSAFTVEVAGGGSRCGGGMVGGTEATRTAPAGASILYIMIILEEQPLTIVQDIQATMMPAASVRSAITINPPPLWRKECKRLINGGIVVDPVTRSNSKCMLTYADLGIDEPQWY